MSGALSKDSWTDYWRSGRGASCFEGSDLEVGVSQVWDDFVDQLADGARVLDLATGNGTVARSCAARARDRGMGIRIDAIDAAIIDPPSVVADPHALFRNVQFHAGTRLESLPFADEAFEGIVSQFGFEYADEEQAAAEVVRCLARGGRLRFVVHAREGAVARDSGIRLERLQAVLAENGPLELVRTLARAAEAGDSDTLAHKSAHLAAAAEQVRRLAQRPPPEDAALFYSSEFLKLWAERDRYWMADIRRSVEDGWSNARGVALRQEEMLNASRTAEDMAGLAGRFAAAGLDVDDLQALRDGRRSMQIGWQLDACKPRPAGAIRKPG